MNLANQITPENIIDITIQYRLTESQVKVAIPSIYIRYYGEVADSSTIRQATILLAEILPYIKYLQIQAALLADGSTVIAEQISTNLSTVITVGLPQVSALPSLITITTPSGLHDGDFIPLINVNSVTANILNTSNTPFSFAFELPLINGDFFENDYSFADTGSISGNIGIFSIRNATTWTVVVLASYGAGDGGIVFTEKTLTANFFIKNSGGANIDSINAISSGLSGKLIAVSGSGYKDNIDVPSGGGIINPLADGETSAWRYIGNTAAMPLQINGTFTVSSAQDMRAIANGGNNRIQTITNVPSTGTQDIEADIQFYTGSDYQGKVMYLEIFSGSGSPIPPVGVAVSAAAGNSSASSALCPAPLITYFTDDGNITTGKTVYTDIGLSIPLAGNDFILSPDGNIYSIDNVTGVVGASSGNSCALPITGKNMFVINTAGGDILVDGNLYSFPAGTNYNIVIKSDSAITNSSGFTKVFKFYKQAPFIPANYTGASASPYTILSGNNITLPNDLTDWNYMSIT